MMEAALKVTLRYVVEDVDRYGNVEGSAALHGGGEPVHESGQRVCEAQGGGNSKYECVAISNDS